MRMCYVGRGKVGSMPLFSFLSRPFPPPSAYKETEANRKSRLRVLVTHTLKQGPKSQWNTV